MRGLDIPPGKKIPPAGLRATVVAACGTGKTFIAAHSALRLARNGRVLVLLPTLDSLTQTVREWRAGGHHGPAVTVCSLEDDPHLWDLKVRSTTSALQLALWHGRGPVTVYATYASLPVLAEAHEGTYGLPMDVFDLVVVDEAHRTSGSAGKAWAAVHDQDVILAMHAALYDRYAQDLEGAAAAALLGGAAGQGRGAAGPVAAGAGLLDG
ncbi:DEAD/DEAH box helicase family protein [Streptomyces sp. ITFR-6]|uniref:DEAD/DEAH box helicase family protein n=1 Tax=Streptomyces sp. ITFR-6 TaxID=3075197 RepID=UPI0037DA4A9D